MNLYRYKVIETNDWRYIVAPTIQSAIEAFNVRKDPLGAGICAIELVEEDIILDEYFIKNNY